MMHLLSPGRLSDMRRFSRAEMHTETHTMSSVLRLFYYALNACHHLLSLRGYGLGALFSASMMVAEQMGSYLCLRTRARGALCVTCAHARAALQ